MRSQRPSPPGSDGNLALFQSTLAEMKRSVPSPAVVLIPGDFLAHNFPRLVGLHDAGSAPSGIGLEVMRIIERGFAQTYPNAQFAIVLGNNDDPCGDYRSPIDGSYLKELAKIWAPLVDRGGAAPAFAASFARGGYYVASLPVHGMRLVALNSVYFSREYLGDCKGRQPRSRAARTGMAPRHARVDAGRYEERAIDAYPARIRCIRYRSRARRRGVAVLRVGSECGFPRYDRRQRRSHRLRHRRSRTSLRFPARPRQAQRRRSSFSARSPRSMATIRRSQRRTSRRPATCATSRSMRSMNPLRSGCRAAASAMRGKPARRRSAPMRCRPCTGGSRARRRCARIGTHSRSLGPRRTPNARFLWGNGWIIPWCAQTELGTTYEACAKIGDPMAWLRVAAAVVPAIVLAIALVIILRRRRIRS